MADPARDPAGATVGSESLTTMDEWDEKIWRLATNPLFLAAAALLQMRQLATQLHAGGSMESVLFTQWLIPLVITVALALAVALWGYRNMWSLTQTVLVGLTVTLGATPLIKAYLALVVQGP